MIRRVIQIDEEKCNGCGACAKACHEGAIGMVNGKAKLMRDDYCDGLGDCLPLPFRHRRQLLAQQRIWRSLGRLEDNLQGRRNNRHA